MTALEHQALLELREGPLEHGGDWEDMEDVLVGEQRLDISHAGGEYEAITDQLRNDIWNTGSMSFLFD